MQKVITMKYEIGFIGCGNMASAIISGLISKSGILPGTIIASDSQSKALDRIKASHGICTTLNNGDVAKDSHIIFLSVKPQFYQSVMSEIEDIISEEQIIVTIAPGKTLRFMEEGLGDVKIVRGAGITGVCKNQYVSKDEFDYVKKLLESFGIVQEIPEALMDVCVSVSGSSPAYVFILIEAMADAAVADGMPRDKAYTFAAQAVLGSAKMVLDTGKHPAELKDMVCSPGGTTIEAVRVLEEKGFRSSVIEAMKACTAKAREL